MILILSNISTPVESFVLTQIETERGIECGYFIPKYCNYDISNVLKMYSKGNTFYLWSKLSTNNQNLNCDRGLQTATFCDISTARTIIMVTISNQYILCNPSVRDSCGCMSCIFVNVSTCGGDNLLHKHPCFLQVSDWEVDSRLGA